MENRISYINFCIEQFAKRYGLPNEIAFRYLYEFKGLEFLDNCYEAEHTLSIREAVDDLKAICRRNGGTI